MSLLKYETCFYNVEELTNKIPDDCIRIVISYLTNQEYFEKMLCKIKSIIAHIISIWIINIVAILSQCRVARETIFIDTHCRQSIFCSSVRYT